MPKANVYEEHIFSKWSTVILGAVTAALLCALAYQALVGPLGDRPAPNWLLLILFLLFLGLTINFATLTVRVTQESVSAGYGIIRHTVPLEDIHGCYLDEASALMYAGWGIRLGRVKGKWRLVYNVIGSPRVVVSLNRGRFREFVFSARKPEEVIRAVKQGIGGASR